jgi:hypothetical protein
MIFAGVICMQIYNSGDGVRSLLFLHLHINIIYILSWLVQRRIIYIYLNQKLYIFRLR